MAARAWDISVWNYESKYLDVLAGATGSFYDVLAAQERLALMEEMLRLTVQIHEVVSEKVHAGKVSPVEEEKTRVVLSTARLEYERERDNLERARRYLAAFWGSSTPLFEKAVGDFHKVEPIPSFEQLAELISNNPDMARWEAEIEYRKAAVSLERFEAAPDISVGLGIRRFEESDDIAYVADASVSIPVFDLNQGSIRSAKYEHLRTREEKRTAEVELSIALSDACKELSRSFVEVKVLRDEVLPVAEKVFEVMKEGYTAGKFGYLEVLHAERTLYEAKDRYLDALLEYHKAAAEVERLIGGPMRAHDSSLTGETEGDNK